MCCAYTMAFASSGFIKLSPPHKMLLISSLLMPWGKAMLVCWQDHAGQPFTSVPDSSKRSINFLSTKLLLLFFTSLVIALGTYTKERYNCQKVNLVLNSLIDASALGSFVSFVIIYFSYANLSKF